MNNWLQRIGLTGWLFLGAVAGLTLLGLLMVEMYLPTTGVHHHTPAPTHLTAVGIGILAFAVCAAIPPRWHIWIGLPVFMAGAIGVSVLYFLHDPYDWQINRPFWARHFESWWVAGGIPLFSGLMFWLGGKKEQNLWLVAVLIAFSSWLALHLCGQCGYYFMALCWVLVALAYFFGSRLPWRISLNVLLALILLVTTIAGFGSYQPLGSFSRPHADVDSFIAEGKLSGYNATIGNGGWIGQPDPSQRLYQEGRAWLWGRRGTFMMWAERTGFVGSVILIAGFGMLLFLCIRIGSHVRDTPGSGLPIAVAMLLFARVYLGIGSLLYIAPHSRWAVPFIHDSKWDTIVNLALLGLVFATWLYRDDGPVASDSEQSHSLPT